jgi:hypothetical protein
MKSGRSKRLHRVLLVGGVAAEALAMRARGYPMGGNLVVRCRRGHLFTTLWIPGASVKAVRMGWVRFQWCPVGRHWSLVTPVKDAELSTKEERRARASHDLHVP